MTPPPMPMTMTPPISNPNPGPGRITLTLPTMPQVQEERQNGRPHEEDGLHDAHGKRRLQHRAALVQLVRERVPRLLAVQAERAQ